ncbi:MAG: hypothetical protein JXR37_31600 [Kiritimatiellae bacterium]|nr:hypothetical protein [Kiritimatiellia bacterium]
MRKVRLVCGGLAVVLCCGVAGAEEHVVPERRDGVLWLFEPAVHGFDAIRHYTTTWNKGSDCFPVPNPVKRRGRDMLELSYKGRHGAGCSTVYFKNIPEPPAGKRYAGVRIEIEYDRDDFPHIGVTSGFSDGTQTATDHTLEKGFHEVEITKGYRRAKHSEQWNLLDYVRFSARGSDAGRLRYRIGRIAMIEKDETVKTKALEPGRVRKVREILPAAGPIEIDANPAEPAWRRVESLQFGSKPETSPFSVRLAYDARNLYIATESIFPTPPVANVTQSDGEVYHDEAQEFFFSGENDNHRMIQFVINGKGTVFDYAVEYDQVAAAVRKNMDKSIRHDMKMTYAGGRWTTELAFPLEELKVDLARERYMGFQIVQSYIGRKEPNLRTRVWSPASRFPDPTSFGVLVFNKEAFGPGEVRVESIQRVDRPAGKADFLFDCVFEGFAPGVYRLRKNLVGGDADAEEEPFSVPSAGPLKQTVRVRDARNKNGGYTLYLSVINAKGDARVHAVNYANTLKTPDFFGQRVLVPEPKRAVWADGTFAARRATVLHVPATATARTRRTADLFRDRYERYTGVRLAVRPYGATLPEKGVVLRVAGATMFEGKLEQGRPEGYALSVEKERVVLTGFDEPGLYYGGVTFFQLLRSSMKIQDQMPVPCAAILDWPDTPNRLCRLEHPWTFKGYPIRENRGIEYLMDWTDRFVAGLKLNVFFLDIAANVTYERRPEFNGKEKIYSLDDLRRYGQFCRDRFIRLCPAWEVGGHANWWLTYYHPELEEKGWSERQSDVTHPDHDPIVYDCMLDVIEALKCPYASPKSDEWWHGREAGATMAPLLRGKTRAEAFLDFHVKLNNWLKRRGVRLLIYHDMLTPYHNGKRFDVYKTIDRFPKDIIIQHWGSHDVDKDIDYFRKYGFEVWINATGEMRLSDRARKQVGGFGKGLYSFGNLTSPLKGHNNGLYSTGALLDAADYAWHIASGKWTETAWLIAARHMLAVRPNPFAGGSVTPLELDARFTHGFSGFLTEVEPKKYGGRDRPVAIDSGVKEIGFIPMRLAGEPGRNCIILREGDAPVEIPVDARFSALSFLHTGYINDPQDERAAGGKCREWMYGWPSGDYIVRYADGTAESLPIRLGMNIKRFDCHSERRATNENRYVLALDDANGDPIHLYQWEWANPHPEKQIASIIAKHDNRLDVSLILFAVSGRGVWQGP